MYSDPEIKEETLPNPEASFEVLRDTLKMKRKMRTKVHRSFIAKNLGNLKYFQNLICEEEERVDFVRECAKHLKYKLYPKGSEVFRKGDRGQNFYIILKGATAIFVPRTYEAIEKDSLNEERKNAVKFYAEYIRKAQNKNNNISSQQTQKSTFHSESQNLVNEELAKKILSEDYCPIFNGKVFQSLSFEDKLLLLNDTNPEFKPYFIKDTPIYKKIATLRDGDYFGEMALIFNQPRCASVIASEDLHVLVLKGDAYKKVFASEIGNVMNKVQFFEKLFPDVSQADIVKFCFLLQERSFQFNTMIAKEGDLSEAIYFLKEGELQLSKISRPTVPEQKKSLMRQSLIQQRIIAAHLLPGSFFGEFDTEKELKNTYTATCQTSSRFYILKKNPTFNVIQQHFPKIATHLKNCANTNQEIRSSRAQSNERLQLSKLKLEDQVEISERYVEEARLAENKLKAIHRKSQETIPLHRQSKYDSIVLNREKERENDLYSNTSKDRIRKSSIFQSLVLSGKDSGEGSKNSILDALSNSTPKGRDSVTNWNYLAPNSHRRKIKLSSDYSDNELSPGTPTSGGNSTSKIILPSIHSPKSSFSGVLKEPLTPLFESPKVNIHVTRKISQMKRQSLHMEIHNDKPEVEEIEKNPIIELPNKQPNLLPERKRFSSLKQFIVSRANSFRSLHN